VNDVGAGAGGFPGSTAGSLFPESEFVEPQHELLDLG
jgi:hypothetical protein